MNIYDLHPNNKKLCEKCFHFRAKVLVQWENGISELRCLHCRTKR
jgi:hypothetical protein